MEAERLAIYFEELGAHQYRQNRKMKSDTSSPSHGEHTVVQEYKDPGYDDGDAWWEEDDEEGT